MMKRMKYMALATVACCAVASAAPITVVNGDFSQDLAKITTGFADAVGWDNTGTTYVDSGVEGPGAEAAFCMSSDDGAYQILNYAMVEGEQYTLTWDSSHWNATEETVTLLSATTTGDAYGATSTLATHVAAPTTPWSGNSLVYTAIAGDTGKFLGISFDNTAAGGDGAEGYINWDNFAVSGVTGPEPPYWTVDPIQGDDGMVNNAYSNSLAGLAVDPNLDPITYSLVGPSTWLLVNTNGVLSGIPLVGHEGTNTFTVAATTVDGTTNAMLNIYVEAEFITPDIVLIDNTTANGSFELSTTSAKVFFVDGDIPDWANWSEVETANDDTGTDGTAQTQNGLDGTRLAFIQPGGAIVNMATNTPYTIKVGDVIAYSVWNSNPGRADAAISLVYDDGGVRTEITGTSITVAPGTQEVGEFTVQAGDAWIGKPLGVGIVDTASGWPEVDQVFLGVEPKPSDPVTDLVITGPINNGTQMVLSWTGQAGASYGVETNSNLIIDAGWQSAASGIPGIEGTVTYTNTIGPDQTFYQVITE